MWRPRKKPKRGSISLVRNTKSGPKASKNVLKMLKIPKKYSLQKLFYLRHQLLLLEKLILSSMLLKFSLMLRSIAKVNLQRQRSWRICLWIWTQRKYLLKGKAWDDMLTRSSQKSSFRSRVKSKSLRSRCSISQRVSCVNSQRNSLKTSGPSKTYSTIRSLSTWFHSTRTFKMSKLFRPKTSWDVCTSSAFRKSPSFKSLASFAS